MKMIPAGSAWWFYPDLGMARNVHNGNWAWIVERGGAWTFLGINVPAKWMLADLAHWYMQYRAFS